MKIKTQYAFAAFMQRKEIELIKMEISTNSRFKYQYWVTFNFYTDPKSYEKAKRLISGFKKYLARRCTNEMVVYGGYADSYSPIARRPHFHNVICSNKEIPLKLFNSWKYGAVQASEYNPAQDGVGYMYENHQREDTEIFCGVAKHWKQDDCLPKMKKVLCCPFREQPHLAGVGSITIGSCAS